MFAIARSAVFVSGALALMSVGCSSTNSNGPLGGAGAGAHVGHGQDEGGPPVLPAVHTTAACGGLPILGDFSGSYGPIPDDCASCVEAQCCDEANACAADSGCKKWKDCLAANGCSPDDATFSHCPACAPLFPTGDSATLNIAFNNCRTSCDACIDLRCAGKPWPTLSAASFGVHLTLTSFTATTPLAGVVVKVCGTMDHECTSTSALDTATTGENGTVDFTMPTGPGGYGGDIDFSGTSIAPSVVELHHVDLVALLGDDVKPMVNSTQSLIDPNTWGLLRGSYNLPKDPGTRSRFNAIAKSCGGSNVPGVTISSSNADSEAVFAYLAGGLPSKTAMETDSSGLAVWENHPAGPTTITITKASSGEKLVTYDYFVRSSVNAFVALPPSSQ